jgi:lipoprotein NlpI
VRKLLLPLLVAAAVIVQIDVAIGRSETGLLAVLNNCQNADLDPEARIEACSELIHANIVSHRVLASLYNTRGVAYEAKHDIVHAIQDYAKALDLKPDFPEAQANLARLQNERPNDATTGAP